MLTVGVLTLILFSMFKILAEAGQSGYKIEEAAQGFKEGMSITGGITMVGQGAIANEDNPSPGEILQTAVSLLALNFQGLGKSRAVDNKGQFHIDTIASLDALNKRGCHDIGKGKGLYRHHGIKGGGYGLEMINNKHGQVY